MNTAGTWFQEVDVEVLDGIPVTVRASVLPTRGDDGTTLRVLMDWSIVAVWGTRGADYTRLRQALRFAPGEEESLEAAVCRKLHCFRKWAV